MEIQPGSLLARLADLPDPRRAQGRRYPLPAILGLLFLAVLPGQSSLRGVWLWGHLHRDRIWQPLGFRSDQLPALTTLWNLLVHIDQQALAELLATWLEHLGGVPLGGISADGTVLRGSRRDAVVGLQVVTLVHHQLGLVLGQQSVTGGNGERGALLDLVRRTPLRGRVLTLDAGLLQRGITRVIPRHGGHFVGPVKHNHREIKAAVDDWIVEQGIGQALAERPPAMATTLEKNRGRIEERSLWVVDAAELTPYLAQEYGWWHIQHVGWLQRRQKRRPHLPWQTQEVTMVTRLPRAQADARTVLRLLRDHWVIENKVHRVRDGGYAEDQGHGRKIGQALAWARNVAISLIRHYGLRYIPDGWRIGSAQPQVLLQWLMQTEN
jgi:hypothetical protein